MKYVRTFREIFIHPARVIDTFVHQGKNQFQHPFLFGLCGITVIIILNFLFVDFNTEIYPGEGDEPLSQMNFWMEYAILKTSTHFLPLTMLLLFIPSLSIPGLFFFREEIEGFYTNLILNSYATGASIVALLLLIPIWMTETPSTENPLLITYLPVLFTGVPIIRIYSKYIAVKDIMGWLRILSSYIAGCMIFFLLKSFSAAVIGYFIFAVNRLIDIWTEL